MRVISGTLKGRKVLGYDIVGTRPTMDRVKESVFASIQFYIKDSIVLDLFSGSGNLGIEAISNGASKCYFVDNNPKAIEAINNNIRNFNISKNSYVYMMDYNRALKKFASEQQKFDIIFIDPPYKFDIISDIINTILELDLLNKEGILVLEFENTIIKDNEKIQYIKKKKYGNKYIYIAKKI